ncbi:MULTISPECIES: EscI/YscI/HrpB family type III secretion system inner rod protein [unclassified Brenneria]|uniref:EscI/YscI/HrpB family type III secretion system inner rod protein n=1 Tax=unclassified Brenneria TaxID=2634434 RepID=UPI001557F8D7|nr:MULTISPECIES: EscI/YscI/HrpB family type III secretion system inner rod protein [unclassified Brenneria]MBJ7220890.1 EscI/YscI/HrpB family type III secretion system inner rod protein [Brenneria sp. L3-3C-1]MEE3642130.1 EscI/YscI/HrpB family type III secretion system inner rod protein [Brenneria sp. L3_3C_1]MEE3650496.1 EscI/YscI/HrpB family type III secretion system inner rod protein [Brenneria sp. HEZEL_4_2_4]NPD00452.1 type III secretion protein [Brenneria sp. hezel4-2-4]
MKITRVNEQPSIGGNLEAEPNSVSSHDVSWFSAALEDAPVTPVSGNSSWLGALAEKSQGLGSVFKEAEREVGQSMRSNNPKDVLDATRTLSSFYLESLLSAKLVAKSVQSLEKLTNLQ